jgi:AAA15 family ATPase/GTPase
MLNSLDIKNYRNLKELTINSLGRVNLITGKNNTGKSTLLEAIAIYVTKGFWHLIKQLLKDRGEPLEYGKKHSVETRIKTLSSLFNNRNAGYNIADAILIKSCKDEFQNSPTSDIVSLKFVKYVDETIKDDGNTIQKRRFLQDDIKTLENYKIGFDVKSEQPYLFPLEEDVAEIDLLKLPNNVQFIKTRNIASDINSGLFDNIALTDKEQNVINALKIIEPLTERIAFIEETPRKRNAVIKLSGSQNILPLQSMGDGINRILTIILALVNANNGYLLIDEFENGLHYSVQENLWKIIFQLSKKLNIQVFATTHSEDCINSFQSVLNNQENLSDGKLIRLDNENGTIKQVEFDAKELKIATEQDIEIR